jgi:hypothetical protein
VFDRRFIEAVYPGTFDPMKSQKTLAGYIIDSDWVPGPETFEVACSVTIGLPVPENRRGGWWCEPSGPAGSHSWSVCGNTLTLAPVGGVDRNTQRGGVFTGKAGLVPGDRRA